MKARVITKVALTQLRRWFRQRITLVVFGAVAILQLTALSDAFVQLRRTQRMRSAEQNLVAQQWKEQPDRHPHRVAHYGYFARRIPSALAMVDQGVSRLLGHSIYLEAHHQNPANFPEALLSIQPQKLAWMDLGSILRTLLPLFLIFIGYSVCSSEAEKGISTVALGSGVPPRLIYYGKALAIFLVGTLLVSPVLVLSGIAVAGSGTTAGFMGIDLWGRWFGLALVYLFWVALVAMGITWISRRSTNAWSSLSASLTAWVILALVLPRLASGIGAINSPLPSTAEFQAHVHEEVVAGGDSHNPNDPHYQNLKTETLKKYGVDEVKDLPVNFGGVVMIAGEEHSSGVYREHLQELRKQMDAQNRALNVLALLNPVVAVQKLSMALAGTDLYHARDFEDQAEGYRYDLVQALNTLHRDQINFENDRAQRLDIDVYRSLPLFRYEFPRLSAVISSLGPRTAGALGIWTLLLFFALRGSRPAALRRVESDQVDKNSNGSERSAFTKSMEATHDLG